jgi:hypothetical protein
MLRLSLEGYRQLAAGRLDRVVTVNELETILRQHKWEPETIRLVMMDVGSSREVLCGKWRLIVKR